MRVLIQIPARAGSKGVPGKNLRTVGGLSLVAHAVRVGRAFLTARGLEGAVVVDTDGEAIAAEAARCGAPVPFMRDPALATDGALTIDATLALLDGLAARGALYDVLVLLQPTSPLRSVDDVSACFDAHVATGSSLTVSAPAHPPQKAMTMGEGGRLTPLFPELASLPRQQLPSTVEPNGAVYVARVELLRAQRSFVLPGVTVGSPMPRGRSIDIDSELDFTFCEALVASPKLL